MGPEMLDSPETEYQSMHVEMSKVFTPFELLTFLIFKDEIDWV